MKEGGVPHVSLLLRDMGCGRVSVAVTPQYTFIYIYRLSYEDSTDSLFNPYTLEYPIIQAR